MALKCSHKTDSSSTQKLPTQDYRLFMTNIGCISLVWQTFNCLLAEWKLQGWV